MVCTASGERHDDCLLDNPGGPECGYANGIEDKSQCPYWVSEGEVKVCECCGQVIR